MTRRQAAWFWACLLLLTPSTAHAHMMIKGMGPFVNGLLHPLVTIPHLLLLLGMGALLGQHPPLRLKWPMLTFAASSALGLLLSTTGWFPPTMPQPLLLGFALVFGVLIASAYPIPTWLQLTLLGLTALLLGLDSAVDKAIPTGHLQILFGTWLCLNLAIYNIAFYSAFCDRKKWSQIGLRVLGSWLAAIAVLVLAFALKK
ncbi:MAG: hypothetical protein D6698_10565 [Gammaproteobacteria bacterium]|nr:MAG: hypothetical protein D6698_10565 [Gammaproteobacteria bacterium]